ncbi:hypothetical protein [Neobacillus kokaensis]|uniref:Uncharacterized protein n=1 Tax=Neobacillus kokaensis TaxID=2759023 RepID=A0ABQ3N250_9BACI|nr:hypothetical protein [Neobacillus kokaensis]GHH96610.1 hypothetical protein AM1BK_01530 [Neobacillus kokaensis]
MGKQDFVKRMMEKQLGELFDKKKAEVRNLEGQKAILRETVGNVIGGKFEHRESTFFHSVDGTLLKVNTGQDSSVSVDIVRSFDSLDYQERIALKNQNPHAYKLLQADLVEVKGTAKVKELLISDGVKYQEFLHKIEAPVKPDLTGLSIEESTTVLRQYEADKASLAEKVNAYNADVTAYRDGTINRQLNELDDQIKEIKQEIGEA